MPAEASDLVSACCSSVRSASAIVFVRMLCVAYSGEMKVLTCAKQAAGPGYYKLALALAASSAKSLLLFTASSAIILPIQRDGTLAQAIDKLTITQAMLTRRRIVFA